MVLRLVDEGEGQDPDEQEGGAEEGVEEELDGGVGPALVSPPGDDEVGGHERQLEHEEEHEQVEGEEAPHDRRLEQEDPGEVDPGVLTVAPEHDGEREQQRSEQHQEDGDPVHPEVPVHPEALAGVVMVRYELETPVVHLHGHHGCDREDEGHERHDQRQHVGALPLALVLVQAEQPECQRAPPGSRISSVRNGTVWVIPTTSDSA